MGFFEWTPNFYIIFVAPPGIVSKSTTANIGMNLLRGVPEITFGPDTVTWQSLVQNLAQSTEQVELEGESTPMSAITIASSEFGNFLNPSDREMVDVLVSLWDGQRGVFHKATKTQGEDRIENPWINIIACTTPSWIEGNFPEYMIGGGFTSRSVFVYGEQKRHLTAYPGHAMPKDFKQMGEDLVHDLTIIATQICGPYIIEEDARAWGEIWYENHYASVPKHLQDERFGGYLARKQTHFHKLAIVLAASSRNERIITLDDLITAEQMVTSTEIDMPKVFSRIATPETRHMNDIIAILIAVPRIEKAALYRKVMSTCQYETFNTNVDSLVKAEYITVTASEGALYIHSTEKLQDAYKVNLKEKTYGDFDATAGRG